MEREIQYGNRLASIRTPRAFIEDLDAAYVHGNIEFWFLES